MKTVWPGVGLCWLEAAASSKLLNFFAVLLFQFQSRSTGPNVTDLGPT